MGSSLGTFAFGAGGVLVGAALEGPRTDIKITDEPLNRAKLRAGRLIVDIMPKAAVVRPQPTPARKRALQYASTELAPMQSRLPAITANSRHNNSRPNSAR